MHLVKFSKRGVFKAPDTLVVTLILIISFALLFGTNSRPAYSLLICTASLSVLGFLYLSASNLTKNVFSDVAVKLYMLYVTSAFLVSIGFSNQNYNEGLRSALVLIGYGAMYIISSLLSQKEKITTLVWLAILISMLGTHGLLAQRIEWLYIFEKTLNHNALTATFINPNHLATVLSFGLIISTALFLRQPELKILTCICIIICGFSLLQTGSRAGISACFFGLLTVFGLELSSRRERKPNFAWAKALLTIFFVLFLGWIVSNSLTFARFQNLLVDAPIRIKLYTDILQGLFLNPFTGYGLGSFEEEYRILQSETVNINLAWRNAHSAPLEILFETGLVVAVFLILSIVAYVTKISKRFSCDNSAASVAAAGVLVTGLSHSIFDNSLATPAVAMVFSCSLGLASHTKS